MIEFRVCWSASSNISFHGESDWEPWDDDEATEKEVERWVSEKSMDGHIGFQVPWGLDTALDVSGFDWWVETREAEAA
jgi:hypothetical protein